MIKPNRRVPGTINSTSIAHINKSSFSHNDTLPIYTPSHLSKDTHFYENTVTYKLPLHESQQNYV